MSDFIRIKNYIINMEALAYVQIENGYIAFGFSHNSESPAGRNHVRFDKGTHLTELEFEQLKEFVLELPAVDRVIIV